MTIVTAGPSADVLAKAVVGQGRGVHAVALAIPATTLEANRLADRVVRRAPGVFAGLVVRDGRDAVARAALELVRGRDEPGDLPAPAVGELRAARAFHVRGEGPPAPILGVELLRSLLPRWIAEAALVQALARSLGERCVTVMEEEVVFDPANAAERVLGVLAGTPGGPPGGPGIFPARPELGAPVRRGPGLWRTVFTNETRAAFKGSAGALLVELGFERDLCW